MRFYLVLTLLISFVAITVFGFAMMGPDDGHMGCIAAMAQGATNCPGAFDMVTLHLNAFNMFSSAVFGQNILSAMILALNIFLLLLLSALFGSHLTLLFISGDFRTRRCFEPPRPTFGIQLNHWLSLHENSPSFT
jgi:hypothetical protein